MPPPHLEGAPAGVTSRRHHVMEVVPNGTTSNGAAARMLDVSQRSVARQVLADLRPRCLAALPLRHRFAIRAARSFSRKIDAAEILVFECLLFSSSKIVLRNDEASLEGEVGKPAEAVYLSLKRIFFFKKFPSWRPFNCNHIGLNR